LHSQEEYMSPRWSQLLSLILHEAYTSENFLFITKASLQVDGLGVVLSLDDVDT
jgi:hypothetical protein